MRAEDNRFYWLSGDAISPRLINRASRWDANQSGATLQGRVGESNQINVAAHGFRKVTVWLAQGMVDFEKTISVYANGHLAWPNRKAAPSMQIMLDDFWRRGDRQRLFVAKIELNL